MAYENINIFCRGYRFSTPKISDANFFNTDVSQSPITPLIDLKEFIAKGSLSRLEYTFDDADSEGGNSLFYEPSEIKFDVWNKKPYSGTSKMQDFFNIAINTSFIKYLIEIYYDGVLRWKGIVNQDGFDLTKRQTKIGVQVLGLEKEFYQYYSTVRMKAPADITWTQNVIFSEIGQSVRQAYIKNVLQQLFLSPLLQRIEMENSLLDWRITETPFFLVRSTSPHNVENCKTSYERFYTAEVDRYGYFSTTCNDMGWNWYFTYVNGELVMNIKNRISIDLPLRTFSQYNMLKDYKIDKTIPTVKFQNIIIIDGFEIGADEPFFSNTDLKGERIILISDSTPENYNVHHFNYVDVVAGQYREGFDSNYSFFKYNGEDDNYFKIRRYYGDPNTYQDFSVDKYNTLFVNGGSAVPHAMKVNFRTRQNTGYSTDVQLPALTAGDMVYTGCAGQQLVKYSGVVGFHYSDYIKTPTFRDNLKKFLLTRDNKNIEFGENQANFNIFEMYNFEGIDNIASSERFTPIKVGIDIENDRTYYTCQKSAA